MVFCFIFSGPAVVLFLFHFDVCYWDLRKKLLANSSCRSEIVVLSVQVSGSAAQRVFPDFILLVVVSYHKEPLQQKKE
jgi:hypothetical protein